MLRAGFATALFLATLASPMVAQSQGGRIVGRVVDAQTGQGLVGVIVRVEAGPGALTGVDGRYVIDEVPAGAATLHIQSLGFAAKTVTDVIVPPGGAVEQTVALDTQALELETIEVSAGEERGSVSRALDRQRTATNIVNAITAEQIARSPDSDAAAAMQRVSGVTVQSGKFVFVRGLGERYTTTSLNGARIPSPDPERKVVPLDLFPSGLLQSITTAKTFTPDQPGDFSGAQVDIQTREFTGERQIVYSLSTGANDRVTGRSLSRAPTVGGEWLGMAGDDRQLPDLVRQAGNFTGPVSQDQVNQMVNAFRNAWSTDANSPSPNLSAGLSVGGTDPLFGQRTSYLVSATYSRNNEVRADEVRAQALAGEDGSTIEVDRFNGATARTSILWGGLMNLSTLLGERTRLIANATYNRTSDNEGRTEIGSSENHGGLPLRIDRLRFVERSVYSAQLEGEHELNDRHHMDWGLTASGVERNEPDRSEIVYAMQSDPVSGATLLPAWFSVSNEGAVRTFGQLGETSHEGSLNYRLSFGDPGKKNALKVGAVVRRTNRDSDNRAYSISTGALGREERELRPEQIFDGRFSGSDDRVFRITPLSQGGAYTAEDRLYAGFVMLDIGLTDRIRVIGGARYERSETDVVATPTIGSSITTTPRYTDVLPALSVNMRLGETATLRLSASQTLARPEYRELAGIQYREVLGGDNVLGNPGLERTLIQNFDARWEWYPNSGEVLSVGVFAKSFDSPIERVYLATSGTRVISFVNAESAENYGVEVEARKRLGLIAESLDAFSIFTNATLMKSEIRIAQGRSIGEDRAMVGQAPYVVNAGLTWAGPAGHSATVLYNIVGKRIDSAAEAPLPAIYEQARNMVDVSLRFALTEALSARFDLRNALDEPYELTQGSVTRESYRAGRVLTLGLSWNR
ncbi:MAG: TonB-dependent receptor domain-containing protein [Longimicrobiales bacterium]